MSVKTRIKRSFANASSSYDNVAALQRQAGEALLAYLKPMPSNATIMDLGCGTGFMLSELERQHLLHLNRIMAVDIVMPMLHMARNKMAGNPIDVICADAEKLPFAGQSVDLIISNLALQWCQHPDEVLSDIGRILKPGGQLLLTTFGPQTLGELKSAWRQVDDYVHVNEFACAENLARWLDNAGFSEHQLTSCLHVSNYGSVLDLLTELKRLGAQTVIKGQNRSLTGQGRLKNMIDAYRRSESGTIPATFEVITLIAKLD